MQLRPVISGLTILFLFVGPARSEPRELLLGDGTVVGALAVGVPPEWEPVVGQPETYLALLSADGPWTSTVMGKETLGRERPSDAPVRLRLGRSIDAVPRTPRHAFRAVTVQLETAEGAAIATLHCATTEVLGSDEHGRAKVRVYRSGPSGERYVLEGWVDEPPTASSWCRERVAYVDTGTLPDFWMRVPARLPRFVPSGVIWWRVGDRCERWAFHGGQLVRRAVTRHDGCDVVTESRIDVAREGDAVHLSNWTERSRSSCGNAGGMGLRGGTGDRYRFVSAERGVWRWVVSTGVAQTPVAYHPDDPGLWSRTRRGCEASLRAATPGDAP